VVALEENKEQQDIESDDEEDTVEEDIGDFSVGQERMKMQS
jgi:hypothetical protein